VFSIPVVVGVGFASHHDSRGGLVREYIISRT
jgi:hypothetical protein